MGGEHQGDAKKIRGSQKRERKVKVHREKVYSYNLGLNSRER